MKANPKRQKRWPSLLHAPQPLSEPSAYFKCNLHCAGDTQALQPWSPSHIKHLEHRTTYRSVCPSGQSTGSAKQAKAQATALARDTLSDMEEPAYGTHEVERRGRNTKFIRGHTFSVPCQEPHPAWQTVLLQRAAHNCRWALEGGRS